MMCFLHRFCCYCCFYGKQGKTRKNENARHPRMPLWLLLAYHVALGVTYKWLSFIIATIYFSVCFFRLKFFPHFVSLLCATFHLTGFDCITRFNEREKSIARSVCAMCIDFEIKNCRLFSLFQSLICVLDRFLSFNANISLYSPDTNY